MTSRILVIDDDAAIRNSLSILLRAKGYELFVASDGAQGFAQFVEHRPAIVISDMVMPGGQGIETLGKIRAMSPETTIVAMSGSIEGGPDGLLKRALEAGADHALEKPFETKQLLDLLARIGDSRDS